MKRLVLILCLLAAPLWAVEPSEMLSDPVHEARAQALDDQLRCVKCRSEAISSSNAAWATDARLKVRELIDAGYSDDQVLDFFVNAYGDYVLMKPVASGSNFILWLSGPAMFLLALGVSFAFVRRRSRGLGGQTGHGLDSGEADTGPDAGPDAGPEAALSEAEEARLREILKE